MVAGGREDSLAERVLFRHPLVYRIKYFLIETVIWRWVFRTLLRRPVNPVPHLDDLVAGRHVLLAACGPGNVSTGPPLDAAARVSAFDLAPRFVEACRHNRPTWEVFEADILAVPRPARSYDVVALYSSLHHIPADAGLILAELARLTRERVIVVEGVLPERGLLRAALRLWYRVVDGGVRYYTRRELLEGVTRQGLVVERVTTHGPIGHMLLLVLGLGPVTSASGPFETGLPVSK